MHDYDTAFPSQEDQTNGLSMLAYFAARAPTEQLWDFEVVGMSEAPKCLVPACKAPDGEAVYDGDIHAWRLERTRRRAAQWPWVWARAVIDEGQRLERMRAMLAIDPVPATLERPRAPSPSQPPGSGEMTKGG
ncbi:MAG: hypothetical protein ACK4WH_00815 [Phycisphaerales bacterium]